MSTTSTVYELYDALHAMPEISWQEEKTAAFLAGALQRVGYEVKTGIAKTGVIGTLRGEKPGPVLGLRADMDALPYLIDGEICAKHTCGHDAHCAMVLNAALLAAERGIGKGTLKIIFQPSEEPDDGALAMIKEGVVDDVDYLFATHLRPIQEMRAGQATPAMFHGSCWMLTAEIHGFAAHGGRPHLAVSAVEAAVLATNAINTIRLDPGIPHSVKVTMLQAGGGGQALNTIPDRAVMAIDLRAQANSMMKDLIAKVTQVVEGSAKLIGATATVTDLGGVPAAENNDEAISLAEEAVASVLGADAVIPRVSTPGADDFHYYMYHKPSLKATYLGLGSDAQPGLHHIDMQFDKTVLENGVKIFDYIVRRILS